MSYSIPSTSAFDSCFSLNDLQITGTPNLRSCNFELCFTSSCFSPLCSQGNILHDVIEVTQVYHCSAKYGPYFTSGAIAYKAILLFFGLFLAWETRKVEVRSTLKSLIIDRSIKLNRYSFNQFPNCKLLANRHSIKTTNQSISRSINQSINQLCII